MRSYDAPRAVVRIKEVSVEIFTLKRKEPDTMRLNIGKESFQIPLAGSLTPEESAPLDTPSGTIAFFQKYLSDEVKKVLTIDDYNAITRAWIEASRKASGKTPGES